MTASRDKAPQGAPDAPEPLGELSRLWSPQELQELEQSRLRYGIGRVLSQLAGDVLGKKLQPKTVVRRLRKLADWIEAELAPKPKPVEQGDLELEHPEPKPPNDVREIFRCWQETSGRRNTALTKGRRNAIEERLESFTAEQLKLVVARAQTSRFWSGEASNDGAALDLEAYMGSHRHVEQLLHEARETGQQMLITESSIDAKIEELEDRAMRLSEEGRIEEANEVQREISHRLGKS